jgi:hypothetical protein
MKTPAFNKDDGTRDFFYWWFNTEPHVLREAFDTNINVRDYTLFIERFGKQLGVEWQKLNMNEEYLVICNPKLYAFAKLKYGF